jgi:hypothetical protein
MRPLYVHLSDSGKAVFKSLGIRGFVRILFLVYFLLAIIGFVLSKEPASLMRGVQSFGGFLLLQSKIQSLLARLFGGDTQYFMIGQN